MSRLGYIFVDDGSPEACEDDTNFVSYDPELPGSYERAAAEANRSRPNPPPHAARTGSSSAEATQRAIKRPFIARKRNNGMSFLRRGVRNVLSWFSSRMRRMGRGRSGKSSPAALLPTTRNRYRLLTSC